MCSGFLHVLVFSRPATPVHMVSSVQILLNHLLNVPMVITVLVELQSVFLVRLVITVLLHLQFQSCVIKDCIVLAFPPFVHFVQLGSSVRLEAHQTIYQ